MAEIFPKKLSDKIRKDRYRSSEITVYEALSNQLQKDFLVFYSSPWLGTNFDGSEKDGEADFIVAHPNLGLLVIEVKGGRIEVDENNKWWSTDRSDVRQSIKNPFEQARVSKHQLIEKLKAANSSLPYFTACHGVILPSIRKTKFKMPVRLDIPEELIAYSDDIGQLETWIRKRFSDSSAEPKGLGQMGCQLLRDLISRPIVFPVSLQADIEDDAHRIELMTEDQCKILDQLNRTKKVVVSGPAGSGKTVLAARKAEMLSEEGKRTLFLCFNRPLARKLNRGMEDLTNVTVSTFHQFLASLHRQAGSTAKLDVLEFSEQTGFEESLLQLFLDSGIEEYDALIIDEAQDFSHSWITALINLVRSKDSGVIYIFLDESQNVRGEALHLQGATDFTLYENLRNTCRIFELSEKFSIQDLGTIAKGPLGRDCEFLPAADQTQVVDQLKTTIGRLTTTENIAPKDIAILCSSQEKAQNLRSSLSKRGRLKFVDAEETYRSDSFILDSVARFKGLESKVVIMIIDQDSAYSDPELYTGITRAVAYLIVVGPKRSLTKFRD